MLIVCAVPNHQELELIYILTLIALIGRYNMFWLEDIICFSFTHLILQALKFFANHKHIFDKLVEMSFVALARYGGGEDGFSLSSAIVNYILPKDGIQCAREMYRRYVKRS